MWSCPKCTRIFIKVHQPHGCRKIPLEKHFQGKEKAKELFDFLVKHINENIGECKIVSIPCCVHLFGHYDFLAALPKKDRLEVRIVLNREIENKRLKLSVPMSAKIIKNCFDIFSKNEIDNEFLGWLKESYYLKG
jgi:hypothetical protein